MYHTQEKRGNILSGPLKCLKDNAWLGPAYYFWSDVQDATFWGITAKKRTGYYDVYLAVIECENVLDTVFNEEHYQFWVTQIEKVKKRFLKAKTELTLKLMNEYFLDKGVWSDFDGIMFQNMATGEDAIIVKDVRDFQYKKRIQLAVYNLAIISNFAHDFDGQCV